MDSPDNAWIFYTLDDTHTPTRNSFRYEQPFSITKSATITAVAIDFFDCISEAVSRTYVIADTPTPTPSTPEPFTPTPSTPEPSTPTPSTPAPTTPTPPIKDMIQSWSRTKGYDYIYFGRKKDLTPLLWRVLINSPDCAILLSDGIQAAKRYDAVSSDWKKSELNNWLNTEYLDITFNTSEKSALIVLDDGYCVTIPTKNDLQMNEYGFSSARTDMNRMALANTGDWNTGLSINGDNGCGTYYTKSEESDHVMTIVMSTGKFADGRITRMDIGVRPMIYVDLDMLNYAGGNGTIDQPYTVTVK